jgi:hypothetical protein
MLKALLFASKCMSVVVPLERQLTVAVVVLQNRFSILAGIIALVVALVLGWLFSRRTTQTEFTVVTLASGARVTLRNGLYRAN